MLCKVKNLRPLFADVDLDICAPQGQVSSTLVKDEGLHLKVVIQLQRLEVLQFAQIPELDRGVVGRRGQVVAILGEGNAGDGARVAREVGHVGSLLQVPDLDLRVHGACSENESIRVELRTRERAARGLVGHLGEHASCLDVREGPVLVIRGAQEIVPSGVEAEACHSALMGPNNLYTGGVRNRPNPDSGVWGGGKHQFLGRVKDHAGDLLGMAFEGGQDLLRTLVEDDDIFIRSTSEDLVGVGGAEVQGEDPGNAGTVQAHVGCHLPVFAELFWLHQLLRHSLPSLLTLRG